MMLDELGVTTIVVHADCADGHASALILMDALPTARVRAVHYASAAHRDIVAEPGLLFCDMTPPRERIRDFVDAGAVVLDHHKGAADIVAAFGDRGVFADEATEPGVSGAVLAARAWTQIRGRRDVPHRIDEFARLVGIYDTWQRGDPDWDRAYALTLALKFVPLPRLLELGLSGAMPLLDNIGPILADKAAARVTRAAATAVRLVVGGHRVAVVSDYDVRSEVCDVIHDADIVASFAYRHESEGVMLDWALRSHAGVNVAAIAKRFGGGGHSAAAGFSEVVTHNGDPYQRLTELLGGDIQARRAAVGDCSKAAKPPSIIIAGGDRAFAWEEMRWDGRQVGYRATVGPICVDVQRAYFDPGRWKLSAGDVTHPASFASAEDAQLAASAWLGELVATLASALAPVRTGSPRM